jgi:hypothetical protein
MLNLRVQHPFKFGEAYVYRLSELVCLHASFFLVCMKFPLCRNDYIFINCFRLYSYVKLLSYYIYKLPILLKIICNISEFFRNRLV